MGIVFLCAEKGPRRAGIPGLSAAEPYDGEDELHPEGLLHVRRGLSARGFAAGPGIARHGCTVCARRTRAREDLPRLTAAVGLANAANHCTGKPVTTALRCGADADGFRGATAAGVTGTDRPASAGSGASDGGPRFLCGPRQRYDADARGSPGPGCCNHFRASSIGRWP